MRTERFRRAAGGLILILLSMPASAQITDDHRRACATVVGVEAGGDQNHLSSVILSHDGRTTFALTNWHLLGGKKLTALSVSVPDHGGWYPATVVHFDRSRDLALLSFNSSKPVNHIDLAARDAEPGEPVFLIGYPGMIREPRVRAGRLVSNKLDDGRTIETTIASHYGDSGGPILSDAAELVGLHWGGPPEHGTPVSEIKEYFREVQFQQFCVGPS